MVLSFVGALLGGYAVLVGVMFIGQRSLMYHPAADLGTPGDQGAADMRVVETTTTDGLVLTSWYRPPRGDARVIVYFHGNAGNIADRVSKVRPYMEAGLGMMLVGYRGYGGNPGSPTEAGLYADAEAALETLAAEGIGPARWVLYGESLGSGIAVEMAWRQAREGAPVGAVVLEAPFTSMGDAAAKHYPYLPARALVRDRYDSRAKIAAIATRLLIFHGTRDRVVPFELGRELFDTAREPKTFRRFDGAAHNDLYDFGAASDVLEFLKF